MLVAALTAAPEPALSLPPLVRMHPLRSALQLVSLAQCLRVLTLLKLAADTSP